MDKKEKNFATYKEFAKMLREVAGSLKEIDNRKIELTTEENEPVKYVNWIFSSLPSLYKLSK